MTRLAVDAIANAANTSLLHGGGVAGAISRAGGPVIDSESRAAAPIGLGEAVSTSGGAMPCTWVIHAATTLAVASRLGARSLALVAFGTGVGGFPVSEAARIEVSEVRAHLADGSSSLERVVFAVRGADARDAFEQALATM